jgi:glycosyltransferase involved in cell wall biosynthesis
MMLQRQYHIPMKLENKTLVLTGGSSGIGLDLLRMLGRTNSIINLSRTAPPKDVTEAARDFVMADRAAGHVAEFVDTGVTVAGVRGQPQPGAEDVRAGSTLRTVSPRDVDNFDLFVLHDGVPFEVLRRTSVPIVVVIHGRPLACRDSGGWDFVATMAGLERVRRLVTLWPRHLAYWRVVVPEAKLRAIAAPPIDQTQFCPEGPRHDWEPRGAFNVLVADSWREIDPWEALHGALLAAKVIPGLRVHTYAIEPVGTPPQVPKAWDYVFRAMAAAGIQGEVSGRKPDMDRVYRAADLVLTPHVIATRIVGEALSCGAPVLGARGNEFAQFACSPSEPESVAEALEGAYRLWSSDRASLAHAVAEAARRFAPAGFSQALGAVYAEALAS